VVAGKELADLWLSGKALVLLILYSILLSGITFVLASNSELSLMPPKEMVYETLKTAISVGLFLGLVIGVDALSGERERATLETLLLTPTSRRQIFVGKFLAAVSPWPAALLITVPYLAVLAQGDSILLPAILEGALVGSIMALGFAGLGMLVSFFTNSNRTSFFVALGLYTLGLVPAQLPGTAQTGATGQFLQWVNPQAAASHFLSKTLVNHRTLEEFWPWLLSPVLFTVLGLGLLLGYAAPRLSLEAPRLRLAGGSARKAGAAWGGAAGLLALAGLLCSLTTAPALAYPEPAPQEPAPAAEVIEPPTGLGSQATQQGFGQGFRSPRLPPEPSPRITVNLEHKTLKATEHVIFETVVANTSREPSPPMTVAMNIVNVGKGGDPVDPEDWSPERTQSIEPLAPGQAATLTWRVNAILSGDYMVYMVAIPEPAGPEATSRPVASAGIHLIVEPFTNLNPSGVLPLALGMPAGLSLGTVLLLRRRRQALETGGAA
jgi:hypothetical protein